MSTFVLFLDAAILHLMKHFYFLSLNFPIPNHPPFPVKSCREVAIIPPNFETLYIHQLIDFDLGIDKYHLSMTCVFSLSMSYAFKLFYILDSIRAEHRPNNLELFGAIWRPDMTESEPPWLPCKTFDSLSRKNNDT